MASFHGKRGALRSERLFGASLNATVEGTRAERGTGLGLVLCRDFVERSGGAMRVSSELGRGTTVSFTLPKALAP